MGRNNYFRFKEFTIIQEHTAMKVGTDGVLLGAWLNTGGAKTILDVGTGTGLIALMMAQRSEAYITAVEIEEKAAGEAAENVLKSPWSNRVKIINDSLQNFVQSHNGFFDLIVSNPPFFSNSKKSKCNMLAMAKHNHLLPYSDLISCSSRVLSNHGRLALIIPVESAGEIKDLAEKENLRLLRETAVRPNCRKNVHRILFEFGMLTTSSVEVDSIMIHNDQGTCFTDKFQNLVRPFYLHY